MKSLTIQKTILHKDNNREFWFPFLLCLLSVLLTHGFLFLLEGVFTDDWPLYTHQLEGRRDVLHFAYFVFGYLGPFAYYHWLISWFTDFVFVYRLMNILSLWFNSYLIYRLCRDFVKLTTIESLLIGMISVIYPAYQHNVTFGGYNIGWLIFLSMSYITLWSQSQSTWKKWITQIVAIIGFACSFSYGAMSIFYQVFLSLLALILWRFAQQETNNANIISKKFITSCIKNLHLFILAPLVWILSRIFFPALATFTAGYNNPNLGPLKQLDLWKRFIELTVTSIFIDGINNLLWWEWAAIVFLIVIGAFSLKRSSSRVNTPQQNINHLYFGSYRRSIWIIVCGIGLMIIAIFPYLAVWKIPTQHGFNSRYAHLIGFSMGFILTGIIGLIGTTRTRKLSIVGYTIITLLWVTFWQAQQLQYIAWHAEWVQVRSVLQNLPKTPGAKEISVFQIDDQILANLTDLTRIQIRSYHTHDWSAMLQIALGKDKAPVLFDPELQRVLQKDKDRDSYPLLLSMFLLDETDLNGCYGKLIIRPSLQLQSLSAWSLSKSYLYYRFVEPMGMQDFLSSLSNLEVTRLNVPEATRCK